MDRATVLVVEDDVSLNEALSDTLECAGYNVGSVNDGREALRYLDKQSVDLVISDIHMPNMEGTNLLEKIKKDKPDLPVMLMTAYGTIEQAVSTIRNGAVDYLVKPFEAEVLVNMVERYVGYADISEDDIIAVDENSKSVFEIAKRVAPNDATVMITGDSGTGKEVVAQYIHKQSNRSEKPFIAINCAAIPENMLEATLFGYEKGAYTGAYKSSPGKFEQAQGGTLLLDEVSEMDLGLQAKLLRVLQEREVERLGGTKIIDLDVRVLATSNRNMLDEVKKGRFREDLYYRLNVFPLHIHSLKNRRRDIVPLAEHIMTKNARSMGIAIPELTVKTRNKLESYPWPGNVRELDNVMQRAMILHKNEKILEEDIYFPLDATSLSLLNTSLTSSVEDINPVEKVEALATEYAIRDKTDDLREHSLISDIGNSNISKHEQGGNSLNGGLRHHEWDLILQAINDTKGSRKDTAEKLGISQRTLRYKLARMRKEGVEVPGAQSLS
ncbi:Flagellar two-component response regulator FleR [hydrothermal vent metagenome]|uniref:Flagellar two-component response regulator FleR n=1 Tax=hydrothermal vent metagenome TaxID=652676 RepID=A0A3B1AE83_9ZZZZ